ncbi:nucleic acid binding protein, putative [Ricinus communis]|uniref:Nucleic acid binding protein, putative n=1 Tax=Ricinus communis TaxID=3988 RepID=B9SK72_RICCO|nr:nucleic acid binding protein, putative [Ricinus communis]
MADDDIGKITKGSRKKKKKWYSSDEYSLEDSGNSGREGSSDKNDKKPSSRRKNKERKHRKKRYSSEEYSSSDSEDDGRKRSGKGGRKKNKERGEKDVGFDSPEDREIMRKEMGLDWMLRPADRTDRKPAVNIDDQPQEPHTEEVKRVNPRELNPYLKDNGSGYPDDAEEQRGGGHQLPSSSVVGDGGASWRLKALKRAQEQAAREGRKLEQVVEERWDSLGQLTVSAASHTVAPARAHLHAIKNRKREQAEENQTNVDGKNERDVEKNAGRGYLKDLSVRHSEMRAPKAHDSLSWGKRKSQKLSSNDASIISAAVSGMNKFADDGSFLSNILSWQNDPASSVSSHKNQDENVESKVTSSEMNSPSEGIATAKEALSANQLAAKALQHRIKGKHEEADKLMEEAKNIKVKQGAGEILSRPQKNVSTNRYVAQEFPARRKEEDADRHLAQKIIQNKQYSLSGRADDEYDFEDGPSRKSRKKTIGNDQKSTEKNILGKRILTQQERCLFCFENPNRPKHLVVSIANFSYLMLPQWQSVVPGHCCILPMQHDSSTRTVDNNVWEEIRNFKKCLIMMFAKQEKDLVFLETVMGLAQQRRHCLIECVPLPREIAKQAPLYFKKAIDEAEDEWSQHNAKKLIDTSQKGLRGSIPKDFPYFHVEFGLNKGFVHVIDDEQQFKSSLGLNVIRGMLRLPEEDMYRRRRHESVDLQKQAVANFAREWEPFDWTKQLD